MLWQTAACSFIGPGTAECACALPPLKRKLLEIFTGGRKSAGLSTMRKMQRGCPVILLNTSSLVQRMVYTALVRTNEPTNPSHVCRAPYTLAMHTNWFNSRDQVGQGDWGGGGGGGI